jgi:hypothetical protein
MMIRLFTARMWRELIRRTAHPRLLLAEPPRGVLLTKEQLGENWPLTVDSIRVDCIDAYAAVAYHGNVTYALNGLANSRGFAEIEPIWRPNPKLEGTRINIGPLIDAALRQCPR